MPRVTLTFDNGPTPDVTPYVLDTLDERSLPALFFVVGSRLAHPAARGLVRRARAAGHAVGNHSMHHAVPLGEDTSPDAVEREIMGPQRLLGDLAGPGRLFRPFGKGGQIGPHLLNRRALQHLCEERYTLALWNCMPRDWEDACGWPERARADVDAHEHTVIVLHDIPTGAMRALPAFLDRLLADGVEVVPELPDSCVPIRDGVATSEVDGLVGVE